MRTIRTKVYQFNELSAEAQSVAIDNYRRINYDFIDLNCFADNCAEIAAENGFDNAKLRYSLSYSQGDGLSFDADIDLERMIKEFNPNIKQSVLSALLNNVHCSCKANTGRYAYASSNDIEFTFENYYRSYDRLNELTSEIEGFVQDKYLELCKLFEKNGYLDIEYQDSDEYIIEAIVANEYEFTIDGNRF